MTLEYSLYVNAEMAAAWIFEHILRVHQAVLDHKHHCFGYVSIYGHKYVDT